MIEEYGSEEAWKQSMREKARKGGQNGNTGGFAAGEEGRKRASEWGSVGGSKPRTPEARARMKAAQVARRLREQNNA